MSNALALATQTGANVRFLVAAANGVNLTNTGNTVATLPLMGGGITKGAAANSSGSVIIRQVTVQNPSTNVSTGNVAILTTNDGNASNSVVSAVVLSNLSGSGKFQDLTIASPYNTSQALTGNTNQALFVQVNTGVAGTVDIRVYGEVVAF